MNAKPEKMDPAFEAVVRRMLATPPRPKSPKKQPPLNRKKAPKDDR